MHKYVFLLLALTKNMLNLYHSFINKCAPASARRIWKWGGLKRYECIGELPTFIFNRFQNILVLFCNQFWNNCWHMRFPKYLDKGVLPEVLTWYHVHLSRFQVIETLVYCFQCTRWTCLRSYCNQTFCYSSEILLNKLMILI